MRRRDTEGALVRTDVATARSHPRTDTLDAPMGYYDGTNLYEFVHANPATLDDPSGLAPPSTQPTTGPTTDPTTEPTITGMGPSDRTLLNGLTADDFQTRERARQAILRGLRKDPDYADGVVALNECRPDPEATQSLRNVINKRIDELQKEIDRITDLAASRDANPAPSDLAPFINEIEILRQIQP
jgi:hypothetical protein